MIRRLTSVAVPVWRGPLVAAGSAPPPIHHCTETHSYGVCFCAPPISPRLNPPPSIPPPPHPAFSCTSGHQPRLFSGHSPCPWDTPFIYFLLNFSALRGSFPAVAGGTGSTLGVSQRLAGVGRDARGAKAAEVVWERDGERRSGRALSGHLIHTGAISLH